MEKNIVLSFVAVALSLAATASATAQVWSFQFSGTANSPTAQTGAAVIGSAGDVWNLVENTGSQSLVDTSGSSTAAALYYTADGLFCGADVSNQFGFYGTDYDNLMRGYLYNTSSQDVITISGLANSTVYDIYVYTQGDYNSSGRELSVTSDLGTYNSSATVATASTFVAGQNYLVVEAETSASGALTLIYEALSSQANINGLQITAAPVPEPATLALAGLGGVAALLLRRRTK